MPHLLVYTLYYDCGDSVLAISLSVSVDDSHSCERLTLLVAGVLQSHCATFNKLFKPSTLSSFANKMCDVGLITADLCDNPVYNIIEEEFTIVLGLNDEKEEFEKDCKEFLNVLKTLSRPLEKLSRKIEKEWRERANRELGITLNLN